MKNLAILTICLSAFTVNMAKAQFGTIKGKVIDEFQGGVPDAYVWVEVSGNKVGTHTDIDGKYTIKPLNPGTYNLTVSYTMNSKTVSGIKVLPDKIRILNDIVLGADTLNEFVISDWKTNIIDVEEPGKMTILSADIAHNANRHNGIDMLKTMTTDIQISEGSNNVIIRGSRPTSLMYFIDGVKQPGQLSGLIGGSIQSITTYTGGIPAKYGDTTSGVIAVETKSYFDLYEEWKSAQLFK